MKLCSVLRVIDLERVFFWLAGLLEPTAKDWNLVWNTYSYMLVRIYAY